MKNWKDWKELLNETNISILALIKQYRESEDDIVLFNLKRMLELRRDVIDYNLNFKGGKTIIRSTEPYDSCPKWEEIFKQTQP